MKSLEDIERMLRKAKVTTPPKWIRKQFVWHCQSCNNNQPGKVKALRFSSRIAFCEPCGKQYLEIKKN